MVEVVKSLIMADRTGFWLMHPRAVSDCIPELASADHYHYLKLAYLYVQDMSQLGKNHPDIVENVAKGYHVIRCNSQFWTGFSPDLVIEQTRGR